MREKALKYLRTALVKPTADFHDDQWESIEAILDHKRVLVVQRTGWGKSMVYFLATRLLLDGGAGPTLLVSPLLSLMRNQIEVAERIGVRARTINSFKQAHNLDGVFGVTLEHGDYTPCLLIDDMVDSRWTFTVAAALLRQVGCRGVYPMALALNSPRMD